MEITSTAPARRSGRTIVTVIMTVLAMVASALHAPAVGAQEAQRYALDAEKTADNTVMMWLDENQPIVRADGTVVYCYNLDKKYPMVSGEWEAEGVFTATKTTATGEVFENSATNPLSKTEPELLGGESLEDNVLEVLETGYPTDVLGLQDRYGLTDAQFYRVTQHAIWYYTDSAVGAGSSGAFTAEMRKVFNILVQSESAESERATTPENLALEMYVSADKKLQNLLSTFRVDNETGEELEKPEPVEGGESGSGGSSIEGGSVAVGGSSTAGGSSGSGDSGLGSSEKLIDGILGSSGSVGGSLGSSGAGESSSSDGSGTEGGSSDSADGSLGSSGSGDGSLGSSGSDGSSTEGDSANPVGSSFLAKCEDSTSSVTNPVAWLIPLGLLIAVGGQLSGVFGPHIDALLGKFNAGFGKNFPDFGVGGSSVDKPSWVGEIEGQIAAINQQLNKIDPALGSGIVGGLLVAIGLGATQAEWDICGVEGQIGSSGSSGIDEGSEEDSPSYEDFDSGSR